MIRPDPNDSRRQKMLTRLKWTRIRQKAWREKPEKMRAALAKATEQARRSRHELNDILRSIVAEMPMTMTPEELKEQARLRINYSRKHTSLVYRMRRLGFIDFREDGLWHNLVRLPSSDNVQESC